ncbi:MAG TPA: serine/threonine-protein kinase [Acetobacteraceae bacterium]|nr:serine/threonine-protein kinase [Acetobacteraceae bacterium]
MERVLGRGAMGVIYQAHDPVIDRRVAIKLVHADLLEGDEKDEYVERFRREAQAAARCAHPNIVAIYDFAMHDGNPFLAMELVEGASLAVALRQHGRFAPSDAVAVMLQVLEALDSAHRIGVVHRDVKPANILLMAGNRVKITDFGIARFDTSDLTQQGAMVGTPSYMSPEQCMGDPVDVRSDLFSAGAVLFEMLTGARPFRGRTSTEITYRLMHEEAPDLAVAVPGVSPGVATVVRRALAKRPADRFASAAEMAEALRAPPRQSAPAQPPPGPDATVVMRTAAHGVSPLDAQQAEKALAEYVGPIAKVLVKRALQRASSPAALWDTLAAEIEHGGDRAAFLRQRPPG